MFRALLPPVDWAQRRPAAIKNPDSAKHCRGFTHNLIAGSAYYIRARGQKYHFFARRPMQVAGAGYTALCHGAYTGLHRSLHTVKTMATARWTQDQIKLAFHLYCQIPYGRIYGRNPEIMALAQMIGRTADAVAMKMLNIASLDPAITSTGRAGLGNASALDRAVWDEFHAEWERLAVECQLMRDTLEKNVPAKSPTQHPELLPEDFTGETRQAVTTQRIKQHFFRRSVLSSYRGRCCMSGLSDPRLLVASHIVPWSSDKLNRLNPSNGLCLSALHDRAFDQGLISLTDDFQVILSDDLRARNDIFIKTVLLPLENQKIEMPERFHPAPQFLQYHRTTIFLNAKSRNQP